MQLARRCGCAMCNVYTKMLTRNVQCVHEDVDARPNFGVGSCMDERQVGHSVI